MELLGRVAVVYVHCMQVLSDHTLDQVSQPLATTSPLHRCEPLPHHRLVVLPEDLRVCMQARLSSNRLGLPMAWARRHGPMRLLVGMGRCGCWRAWADVAVGGAAAKQADLHHCCITPVASLLQLLT